VEITVTLSHVGPRWVSDDSAFAVWNAALGSDPIVLTGPLGHVSPAEELVCVGDFAEHPRYGRQFVVESFHAVLPTSAAGIERWLISRVPGIGPTFAKAIVAHFGAEQVFDELDRDPERLREVRTKAGRAISRKSVQRAIEAWREVATVRAVESFLFAHGIGAGLAARLVQQYGGDVIEVLQTDPYRLTEVRGIGFKHADRIAQSLGIEPDDPARLRAGVQFVLQSAESDGNTFLLPDELRQSAGRLLGVGDPDALEHAVRSLVMAAELVVEDGRIYRSELWETEQRLGELLGARANVEAAPLFDEAARPDLAVSDEQWSVVELVRTRPLVLLTGLPGAGKTHTQRVLVDIVRQAKKRVLLCAPTGKAARRMRDLTGHDAMTIHRALGYSPLEGFDRDEDKPLSRDYDLVIVDESSMLSLELADALFRAVGSCHVLLVGDTDQLPPIGPGRVLADLVACGVVPRVHLTAIYRQAARSLIIQSARRINGGELPFFSVAEAHDALGEDAELEDDFYFVSRSGPETTLDGVLELVCDRLPARGFDPRADVMTLVPMRRGTIGLLALNAVLEQRLNPGSRPVVVQSSGIRVGSRIVQTKNDYTPDKEVMNGEVAFVLSFDEDEDEVRLSLDEGEREIVVPTAALATYDLGWALTVHRSQGSQFPAVVAPWSTQYAVMLSRSLLYTAVTRAQRLCVLVGEKRAVSMAVLRSAERRRNSALAERIQDHAAVR